MKGKQPRRYHYYYLTDQAEVVRICGTRRPSIRAVPKSGTWVLFEYHEKRWVIGSFPEITLRQVEKLTFIGKVKL